VRPKLSGWPYSVDETKPKAKHAPKEGNRRTVIGPHAAAALRLLVFTGARLREILHLKWEHVDSSAGYSLADKQNRKENHVLNAPRVGDPKWPAQDKRLRHRRIVC